MNSLIKLTITTLLMILLASLSQTTALTDGPPDRPTPGLPQRPEGSAEEKSENDDVEFLGAYIELHINLRKQDMWAVVQWQDINGDWHDVNGWRSQIHANPLIKWWVAPKDLSTGPFRWKVYQAQDRGKLIWASQPFYLPKRGETLRVSASVQLPSGFERPDHRAIPPKEHRPPQTLMPVTGGRLDTMSWLVTTTLSVTATLVLIIGGFAAVFRKAH